jgi:hypothetical protein
VPASVIERYVDLPGLRSSPHAGLKAELALLVQERMTPQALDGQLAGFRSQARQPTTAGRRPLDESIPAISRPLLKAQLDQVYRGGPLHLSPVQLEQARDVLRRWADDRLRFEQALDGCSGGLGMRIADGNLADVRFLDVLNLGCRLEALAAAEALAENEPEQSLPPLGVMLRAARLLAAEWNVTTRVSAANLRADALHVLDAIANHDLATRDTHARLAELLARETSDWPADAAAWVGDRTAGLLVYELVRDGHYLSLLEHDELQQLRDKGLVDATAKAVVRTLDADELFYLSTMRRIVESCRQPYFERVAVLGRIRGELAAREQSGDYPLVAGRLLLDDFEPGHERQAEDLARCTAWQIALAAATGTNSPADIVSPLTGQPLRVQTSPHEVRVVGFLAPGDELTLAIRAPTSAARVASKPE